ncbi:nucleotidyltransferase domain-containing protein [Thermodesulfovibrionales bacterium]|nr:nucleotidyltransferase domain-containing protein [Thermodesulfovibrionales bacterium]
MDMEIEGKIKAIKEKIIISISPEKIVLFGSHAAGVAAKESDIDLVVIWASDLNPHQRSIKIRRLFPRRDFSLDVFVFTPEEEKKYKDIKGTILHTAFTEGVLLYERK